MKRYGRVALLIALLSAYAAVALWWTWPLVTHPGSSTVQLRAVAPRWAPILFYDRLLTIAGTARNAAAIAHGAFAHLIDTGLCYPFPHPATLGEHMIELGLLALPFRLLSVDPVVLHNATLLVSFLLSGLGMFAWVYFWTGSAPAAVIAGLALAVHPARLTDLSHPAVVAVHWIPFILLFFDRLLESGRTSDAVLLALAASLQVLTGAYPLLITALLVAVYGSVRLIQRRRFLNRKNLMFLAAAMLCASATAAAVLMPYSHMQKIWALFRPRTKIYADYRTLLYGGRASLGLFMPLAALAAFTAPVWDAIHAWRSGDTEEPSARRNPPLLALALAGLVCTSFAARGVLWQGGPQVPSLQDALVAVVPLIGSVRVPAAVFLGTVVVVSALGGLGLARLIAPRSLRSGLLVTVAALLIVGGETFLPTLARAVHGREFSTQLRPLSANEGELAAYRALGNAGAGGAVLDLPFPVSLGRGIELSSHYTFLAAYYDRPTAACYNSFDPPTQFNLARIAARLPSRRAIDELKAAGIGSLVLHRRWASPRLLPALREAADVAVLVQTREAAALRLTGTAATHHDRSRLEVVSLKTPAVFSPAVKAKEILASFVHVIIRNNDKRVWAQPLPIRPLHARLFWYDTETGLQTKITELRLLLPLALAAGAVDGVPLNVAPYPRTGSYRLELEIEELDVRLQAASEVRVFP